MKLPVFDTATTLLFGLGMLVAPLSSVAQSYQIEAEADLSLSFLDFDAGGDGDGYLLGIRARGYLQPVETVGPWSESAFLQKSSSAGIELTRSGGDFISDTDFGVDLFYVTPDDIIFGGELSSSDATDISVFGGIYLDDRTTAIARISLGDTDSIGAEYKRILQTASGNDLTAEASLFLLDAADTGLGIAASGVYFLSDQLGVLGGLSYQDIGDFDEFTLITGAEYFLSETIAARGGLSFSFGSSVDDTTIIGGVVARF